MTARSMNVCYLLAADCLCSLLIAESVADDFWVCDSVLSTDCWVWAVAVCSLLTAGSMAVADDCWVYG